LQTAASDAASDGHAANMSSNGNNGRRVLEAKDVDMAALAAFLTDQAGRTVIDKTGLNGYFDFELKWVRDDAANAASEGVGIFTAVEEQLGLKLESSKGPVDTLVVDSIEQPTEN